MSTLPAVNHMIFLFIHKPLSSQNHLFNSFRKIYEILWWCIKIMKFHILYHNFENSHYHQVVLKVQSTLTLSLSLSLSLSLHPHTHIHTSSVPIIYPLSVLVSLISQHWCVHVWDSAGKRRFGVHPYFFGSAQHILFLFECFGNSEASGHSTDFFCDIVASIRSK